MKVQVVYSSLTGRTQKVAEAIFNKISADEKTIHNLKDGEPVLDGDVIIMGYWVNATNPNQEMLEFMQKVKGKTVGVFCTLGYYADSEHAHNSIKRGVDILKENNTIIGSYVCNGTLSDAIIQSRRKKGCTIDNEYRWEVMKNHPTDTECALAGERFEERLKLYSLYKEGGVKFKSII